MLAAARCLTESICAHSYQLGQSEVHAEPSIGGGMKQPHNVPEGPQEGHAEAGTHEDLSMRLQQLESDMLKVTLVWGTLTWICYYSMLFGNSGVQLTLVADVLQVQNILLLHNERWQSMEGAAEEAVIVLH